MQQHAHWMHLHLVFESIYLELLLKLNKSRPKESSLKTYTFKFDRFRVSSSGPLLEYCTYVVSRLGDPVYQRNRHS